MPSSPAEVGFHDTPGSAIGVAVAGDRAYVADGEEGLRVVDVSTPSSPAEVASHATSDFAWGVTVVGDYVYVADYAGGLFIFGPPGVSYEFAVYLPIVLR